MTTRFELTTEQATPTMIGKAWWHRGLRAAVDPQRRSLLTAVAILGGMTALPVVCNVVADDDDDDGVRTRTERRNALALQRAHGWTFGVADAARSVRFPGAHPDPDVAAHLATLVDELAPTNPQHRPWYVPTLFESVRPGFAPSAPATEDRVTFTPLADVVKPIHDDGMSVAEARARALAAQFSATNDVAVVVDLPGPRAVAAATGLSSVFDPVFLFDNWPHPLGVVPSHLTLAATLDRLPALLQARAARSTSAPPVFVLDRDRLALYGDDANQFDNRWIARMPGAAALHAQGITKVFLVVDSSVVPHDSDDLVDDLVAWQAAGIDVRAIDLLDLPSSTTDASPGPSPVLASWRPAPRVSPFSSGTVPSTSSSSAAPGEAHLHPPGFGEVPVVLSAVSGRMLGAVLYRSGSWNRVSSSSSFFGGG